MAARPTMERRPAVAIAVLFLHLAGERLKNIHHGDNAATAGGISRARVVSHETARVVPFATSRSEKKERGRVLIVCVCVCMYVRERERQKEERTHVKLADTREHAQQVVKPPRFGTSGCRREVRVGRRLMSFRFRGFEFEFGWIRCT